jgi:hypothetical protein
MFGCFFLPSRPAAAARRDGKKLAGSVSGQDGEFELGKTGPVNAGSGTK